MKRSSACRRLLLLFSVRYALWWHWNRSEWFQAKIQIALENLSNKTKIISHICLSARQRYSKRSSSVLVNWSTCQIHLAIELMCVRPSIVAMDFKWIFFYSFVLCVVGFVSAQVWALHAVCECECVCHINQSKNKRYSNLVFFSHVHTSSKFDEWKIAAHTFEHGFLFCVWIVKIGWLHQI